MELSQEIILHPNTPFSEKYEKKEYDVIIRSVPEFFDEYPKKPNSCYEFLGKNNAYFFGGILGIDSYYKFYGHILSKRNENNENYFKDKDTLYILFYKLVELYQRINMRNGFEHIFNRIPAFAEYELFYKDNSEKIDYDITKQIIAYFDLLKQYAKDETSNNYNFSKEERMENLSFCLKKINQIEELTTSRFLLLALQKYNLEQLRY